MDDLINGLHESYYRLYIDQLPEVRYVVSYSTGASSAVAAERAIQAHGKHNVDIVFCDTLVEDVDNYRFMADCEKRWGVEIIKLVEGRTPLQVAEDEHIIPNQKIAPCTKRLKIEPFVNYLKGLQAEGYQVTVILGMNATEKHRHAAPRRNYGAIGCAVDYPLMHRPIELDPVATVKSWGIAPPRMYRMGFSHANCGAQGCVKFGKGDWRRMLTNFPDGYHQTEQWEAKMRQDERFQDYALLRDFRGGEQTNITLEDFRKEHEAQYTIQPRLFDFLDDMNGCSLECGAGDPSGLAV